MTLYTGGCHCGNVRYQVDLDLSSGAMACNCSICSKKGYFLTFVPFESLKLLSGEDSLSDYQFNKMNIHHLFCKKCGVTSFCRGTGQGGKPIAAINARCLDGVDLESLAIKKVDGKSF